MIRNFLKGALGDAINALLAACAFNVRKRYNQIRKALKGKAQLIFDLIAQRIFLLLINQKLLLKG